MQWPLLVSVQGLLRDILCLTGRGVSRAVLDRHRYGDPAPPAPPGGPDLDGPLWECGKHHSPRQLSKSTDDILCHVQPFYVEKQFIERICLMRCIHRENGGTFGKRFTRDLRIGRSPTSLTIRFGDGRPPTWSLGHSEQTIVSSADSSLSDSSPSGSSTSPPSVFTPTPCWEQI